MNLRDLQYVIAVAEEKHFGRAADRCHVSQPALSGQIQKLTDKIFTLEQTASYATTPADAKRHANLVALFAKSLADNPTLDALAALTKAKDVSKRKLSALFNTAFTAKGMTPPHHIVGS